MTMLLRRRRHERKTHAYSATCLVAMAAAPSRTPNALNSFVCCTRKCSNGVWQWRNGPPRLSELTSQKLPLRRHKVALLWVLCTIFRVKFFLFSYSSSSSTWWIPFHQRCRGICLPSRPCENAQMQKNCTAPSRNEYDNVQMQTPTRSGYVQCAQWKCVTLYYYEYNL